MKWYWWAPVLAVVTAVLLGVTLLPYFKHNTEGLTVETVRTLAVIYYAPLFFAVLLAASVALLLTTPSSLSAGEQRDYRVVHFTLRLALTFGIGAVMVAVVLVAALLGPGFIKQ